MTIAAATREHLRTSAQTVFYISRTATNLLGVERSVPGLSFITMVDSWDGTHPAVFVPSDVPRLQPRGNVNVVNWLLRNAQVRAHIDSRTPSGVRPQVVLAFFDAESERLCDALGYDLIMPSDALRTRLDSKIVTTQLGDSVGVASVPNILTTANNWDDVLSQATAAGLGGDLVVQTPYGNSGQTTYFMSSEPDYERVAAEVRGAELKIMRRINHRPIAVDAILTRHGTVVGPFLNEVTGHAELTRYRGGWAGNEMGPGILSDAAHADAVELVRTFGDRLGEEGYRGAFGVDLLLDTDTGDVYLGELNPRLSGALSLSNLPVGPFTQLPLFAYHLLEYSDADFAIDGTDTHDEASPTAVWSHVIIQHTAPEAELIHAAPRTGRYRVESDMSLSFISDDRDWHGLDRPDEVFYLRVLGEGEYRTQGVDLGVLVLRDRVQHDGGELTDRAKALISSVEQLYTATRLSTLRNFFRRVSLLAHSLKSRVIPQRS